MRVCCCWQRAWSWVWESMKSWKWIWKWRTRCSSAACRRRMSTMSEALTSVSFSSSCCWISSCCFCRSERIFEKWHMLSHTASILPSAGSRVRFTSTLSETSLGEKLEFASRWPARLSGVVVASPAAAIANCTNEGQHGFVGKQLCYERGKRKSVVGIRDSWGVLSLAPAIRCVDLRLVWGSELSPSYEATSAGGLFYRIVVSRVVVSKKDANWANLIVSS